MLHFGIEFSVIKKKIEQNKEGTVLFSRVPVFLF